MRAHEVHALLMHNNNKQLKSKQFKPISNLQRVHTILLQMIRSLSSTPEREYESTSLLSSENIKAQDVDANQIPKTHGRSFSFAQKLLLCSLILLNITSFASVSIISPFFPIKAKEKGISTTWTGIIFSVYSFFVFLCTVRHMIEIGIAKLYTIRSFVSHLVSPCMGKLINKVTPKSLLLWGALVGGVANIVFGYH